MYYLVLFIFGSSFVVSEPVPSLQGCTEQLHNFALFNTPWADAQKARVECIKQ